MDFSQITKANKGALIETKTINDFYNEFISYLDVKPQSAATYTRNLRPFILYVKDSGVKDFTSREFLISFKKQLADNGLKANTINNYLIAVKQFFNFLFEYQYIKVNHAAHIKGLQTTEDYLKSIPTTNQARTMLFNELNKTYKIGGTTESKRNYAIMLLMIICGLRTNEIINIKLTDIAEKDGRNILYVLSKGKTDKTDFVVLPDSVIKAINSYLCDDVRYSLYSDYLFTSLSNSTRGTQLTTRTIRKIAKKCFESVNLTTADYTAHSLRHYALTHALLNGSTIEQVKQVARHKNINTTMRYIHTIDRINNCSEERNAAELGI